MKDNILEYNRITPFKNRKIDYDKDVKVYRNLSRNGELGFSIQQNGKVVGHTNQLMLRNCVFLINEKAREKIVKTKRKVVHAFIKGTITHSGMGTSASKSDKLPVQIKYNPFLGYGFHSVGFTPHLICLKGAQVVKLKDYVVSAVGTF